MVIRRISTPYPQTAKRRFTFKDENAVLTEYCKDMLQKSMLTGVPQIVSAKSVRSKVFKTFVFLGSVTGFLYQTCAFLSIYFSYPTLVDVQVTTPPYIDIPSITVCNRNGIRRSRYCEIKPENCAPLVEFEKFCNFHPELCDNRKLLNNTLHPLANDLREEKTVTQNLLRVVGHSAYPLIFKCRFKEANVSFDICNNSTFKSFIFQDIYDKMKLCYIINARWSQASLNLPQAPVRAELHMVLDLEPEEYFTLDRKVAAQVSIHSPWNIHNPFIAGFSVEPKKVYIIQIKEDIKNLLPMPYQTNCTDYIKSWYERGGNGPLSKEMCIEECVLNQTMDHCGCALTSNLYPHKFTFCGKRTAYCINAINYTHCFVKCSPACHSRQFEIDVKKENIEVDMESSFEDQIKWNRTAILILYFKSTRVNIYTYRAKYESIELFSFLGGYVGIWLGISLIALLDFLESLASFVVFVVDRMKHSNRLSNLRSALGSKITLDSAGSVEHRTWAVSSKP